MLKKKSKSPSKGAVDRSSIVAGIKKRLAGDTSGNLFIRVQESPKKNNLRLLGPCLEIKKHVFQGKDGRWHGVLCAKKQLVGDGNAKFIKNDNCLVCKQINNLIEAGKSKEADRLKARSSFVWNAIYKEDPNNADGELIAKVFEHSWTVFEGIGDILEDRDDFQHPKNGIGIMVRKKVKGVGQKKNTKYFVSEGEPWPLSEEERALELNDLNKIYQFPKDESVVAEALGMESSEYEEEEDADTEDEDTDEEESEKKVVSKKSKKNKVDEEDLDDDEEEEEEDEEEEDDEEEDEDKDEDDDDEEDEEDSDDD